MSDINNNAVQEKLRQLATSYVASLPGRMQQIQHHWQALVTDWSNEEQHQELRRLVHSLAGSGTTFGFSVISVQARALEHLLQGLATAHPPSNEEVQQIETLIVSLEEAIASPSPVTTLLYDHISNKRDTSPLIYLVDNDPDPDYQCQNILEEHGYSCRQFATLSEMTTAVKQQVPAIVIMKDINMLDDAGDLQTVQQLNQANTQLPLVVISAHDGLEQRLRALRAGVSNYFGKPLGYDDLLNTLDKLTLHQQHDPYRILIIDDDRPLAEYYAEGLHQAGMRTEILTHAGQLLEKVKQFAPELILMDVYMPDCGGIEAATILRQFREYDGIPIIFLSSEQDFNKQLQALSHGGDDFLAKPLTPEQLVISVNARVQRARQFRQSQKQYRYTQRELENQKLAMDQHAIISIADIDGNITYVNDRFCQISGFSYQELAGQNHRIINSGEHDPAFWQNMWHTISQGQVWHGEVCNRRKDGSLYWVESTIVPFLGSDGLPYQYVSIRTDVTKLMETRRQVMAARDQAEQANRAKSEFLSRMSHELRTPMNAILGFTQLLQAEAEGDLNTRQHESLGEILKAGQHLLELINEILDLARIEAGRMDICLEDVALDDILQECISLMQPNAQQRRIDIELQHDDTPLLARADRVRLKQVILNLLSNAIKYNRENGRVIISKTMSTNQRLRINVTDTGTGISVEDQGRLFEAFNRLRADIDSVEGAGIGLVITRRLVELMGGRMGMESHGSMGSTFWFELRRSAENARLFHGADVQDDAQQLPATTTIDGEIKNVLYVEDNPANLKLVQQLLSRRDHVRLHSAATPDAGLQLAAQQPLDLVLLDINLPGMDGFELMQTLQGDPAIRDVPMVAVSANAMPADIKRAIQAGFCDYLTKPLNVDEFYSLVDRLLAPSHEQDS